MHLVVIYSNIGGYHAARLSAAQRACRERGWRLTAIQVTDSGLEHPWGELEVDFPVRTLLRLTGLDPRVARDRVTGLPARLVRRALDDLRPDAVAVPGWGFAAARAALDWCRQYGVPVIAMSDSKRDDHPRVWWRERLKSHLFIRRYAAALVAGEAHRRYIIELGMPAERVFLGHAAVDNEHFRRAALRTRADLAAAREREPRLPTGRFFLAVTRMLPRKNVPSLVKAYSAYRSRIGPREAWQLAICGSGAEERQVRTLVGELGMQEHVALPGFVAYRDIGEWYGAAAAFVHAAAEEQWGLVVNEACAAGLPIICSRTVGARYHLVLEAENGLLFDPDRPDQLTEAMVAMHSLSDERRDEMARVGQGLVAEFSPDHFARGLISAIESVRVRRGVPGCAASPTC